MQCISLQKNHEKCAAYFFNRSSDYLLNDLAARKKENLTTEMFSFLRGGVEDQLCKIG